MEEFFNTIFGENESIDSKTFNDRLAKSGVKLVDISRGDYVSKKKYDDEISSLNKKYNDLDVEYKKVVEDIANGENDDEKKYNEFMKQFSDLKATSEATAKELDLYKKKEVMRSNGIENQRFMDLALFELRDSKDFDNDIKTWAETNKELITPQKPNSEEKNPYRTSPKLNGNPSGAGDGEDDAFMSAVIKSAGLKADDLK